MHYLLLTATKTLLVDLYHNTDWLNSEGNIALWEIFYRNYDCECSELKKDIELLESKTPSDLAFFVNSHAKGASTELKSDSSQRWLSEYKQWVFSKCQY